MRVLLLSGYDAPSHKRWREGLVAAFPDWSWTQLTLPPRHFKWRMRGSGFLWAQTEPQYLPREYDLLVAPSMVDLACLRGLMPELARLPSLVYFHENQFAYPTRQQQKANIEPQLVNLFSAACADRIAFNSHYNQVSFFRGAEALLRRLPDAFPAATLTQIKARSQVLPVPLEAECFKPNRADPNTLTLVWNHRWEYDKGPDRLLAALRLFARERPPSVPVKIHLLGQQFRREPEAFAELKPLLSQAGLLGHWGFVPNQDDYRQILARSHGVLSTALHDFQGLSVLEGAATGCRPLVPDREAYPEWFAPPYLYTSDRHQPEREARALADSLLRWQADFQAGQLVSPAPVDFVSWAHWRPAYASYLTELAGCTRRSPPVS